MAHGISILGLPQRINEPSYTAPELVKNRITKKTLSMRSVMAVICCTLLGYACSTRDENRLFLTQMIGKSVGALGFPRIAYRPAVNILLGHKEVGGS